MQFDPMTVSLSILALCTLVQTGFFLYDRLERWRYFNAPPAIAPRPSLTLSKALLVAGVAYILGFLLTRAIDKLGD